MTIARRPSRMRAATLSIGFAIAAMSACSTDPTATIQNLSPAVVAGRAVSADVVVSSAAPDSASQDTTLDVTINGSGFISGSNATWALHGVSDPLQIRTNRTTYVSSRKLIANITISASATVAKWDIVVTASGKGGIGTEMFAVKVRGNVDTDPKANLVWEDSVNVAPAGQPEQWEPALITGDYRNRDGSPITTGKSGEFQHSFCGSSGLLRTNTMPDTAYALNFEVDWGYTSAMDVQCGGIRYYQFYFSGRSAAPLRYGPQHYALKLATLQVGQSLSEEVHFGIQQTNCAPLRFDDAYPPSNNARVTRLTDTLTFNGIARRWRVESQGSHRAACTVNTNKGPKFLATYYMPFAYTITEVIYPFPRFP